jgi:hypothetical protein
MVNNVAIEGGLSFYALLDNDEDETEDEETEDVKEHCLITFQPLTRDYVRLPCGHAFNYVPLFYDLREYKSNYTDKEEDNAPHIDELRCPHCRTIHSNVLPYYPHLMFPKIHGVNWVFPMCEYITHTYLEKVRCYHVGKPVSFYCHNKYQNPDFRDFIGQKCACLYHIRSFWSDFMNIQRSEAKELKKKMVTEAKELKKKEAMDAMILKKKEAKEAKELKKKDVAEAKALKKKADKADKDAKDAKDKESNKS